MHKINFLLVIILISECLVCAQEAQEAVRLSLRECVQVAVDENISITTARLDREINQYRRAEAISALIPRINVGANFQNNLKLPKTMLPGEINIKEPGTPFPVQMGSKFVTGAAATLNMVLYNQTVLTALQLSKKVIEIGDMGIEKAAEELAFEVSKLYCLAVVTSRQKIIVSENIERTMQMQEITKVLRDNGMVTQVDYDRISVSLENLYTQLDNVEMGLQQQHNMIKYMLNIPLDKIIVLTDTTQAQIRSMHVDPPASADFSEHIDIRLLNSQNELNLLNQKMIKSGYMPSLSFTYNYSYQASQQKFSDYFNSPPENDWHNASYIGLSLNVPIFDGREKRSKLMQVKTDYQKTELLTANRLELFTADYQNAVNNYHNNLINVERQMQNMTLARKVYDETALRYREGLASMSDLLQDEMSLSNAQANMLTAMYNYKEAELIIMSLNGDIRNLYLIKN